jgi:RNA polymerase sigma-70 factor (ECF subfamily)
LLAYHHLAPDEHLTTCGAAGVDVLYRRHHSMVLRYCLGVLRTPEAAADAGQSTWMQVSLALSSRDTIVNNFRPWVRTIARHECFDLLRARGATRTLDITALELAGGRTAHDVYESREQLRWLVRDLQALSERQRVAIVLREMCGLGADDAADMLDTTPKRASGLVADARRALAQRELGRALACEQVRNQLTNRPHSVGLRAHLEVCRSCQSADRGPRSVV